MVNNANEIIIIDGESASGKSSVADAIALKMGYIHLDSGIIFRTMGYLMDFYNLELDNLATSLDKYSIMDNVEFEGTTVKFRGADISFQVQSETAGLRAASLGRYEHFQNWFIGFLKKNVYSTDTSVIVSGRIGGSVIFPLTKHKFYLQAELNIKAKRRYEQLLNNSGSSLSFEQILRSISCRDDLQSIIHYWKLRIPENTKFINTSAMTIAEVVDSIIFNILDNPSDNVLI